MQLKVLINANNYNIQLDKYFSNSIASFSGNDCLLHVMKFIKFYIYSLYLWILSYKNINMNQFKYF